MPTPRALEDVFSRVYSQQMIAPAPHSRATHQPTMLRYQQYQACSSISRTAHAGRGCLDSVSQHGVFLAPGTCASRRCRASGKKRMRRALFYCLHLSACSCRGHASVRSMSGPAAVKRAHVREVVAELVRGVSLNFDLDHLFVI
jgi:hypothetical protein